MIKSFFCFILIVLLFQESASGQFYFFGRNKVQYDQFDWKILRTENFDIYYYDDMGEIAEIGGAYAEEIYDELKERLNHVVTRRIPLIFYNTSLHFQQTNITPFLIPESVRGFFEFLKGRVVIPSTGSLKDFRHVIRHEIVHVFMVNKIFRIQRDRRLPTGALPPLWFVEGLAEYLSTEIDAQAEMVMRDAVINNYFVGIKEMYRIYGTFLMYKEGQFFLEFVDEVYGKDKIPLFLDNFWMHSDFNKVIEYTLGKNIDEIDSEWSFHLKRKYYPLLKDNAPLEHGAEKLTNWGFNFNPVHYKHNGTDYLYFIANRDGYSSLYRLAAEREGNKMNDPELVLRGERKEEFESFHLFQPSLDVSKDGIVLFVTKTGGTDAIHFYSIKENSVIHRYQNDDLISITSPKFSSDGKRLVFQAVDRKGFSDIFLLFTDNDSLVRLTNDYCNDRTPSFGLTDDHILFSSDRTAGRVEQKYNLFFIDINTRRIEYITYADFNHYSPVLSPGKDKLFFTTDFGGVRNVWSMEISENGYDGTIDQVTNFITSAFDPSFIDNETIAFTGFEKFSFNLYKLNLTNVDITDSLIYPPIDLSGSSGRWFASKLGLEEGRRQIKYEKEYTLDYAQSQITTDPIFGTRGGAIFSLSDLLGDDNFFFLIYNTADVQSDFLKSFNVAIQRINLAKRVNYGYGVFHFSGRRYDIRETEEFFFERSFGGFFLLNFPLSKFSRIEAAVTVANSDKQVIAGVIERKAMLVSNTLAYVVDNSLWGPTGPLDGVRARLLLGFTGDVKFSNVNYFTVIADYRHYFRLGFASAVAFRSTLQYNEGKEARRYFMGGSWDLRGWPRWSIRGEKLWLTSLELRFPLINQLRIKFPFIDIGFFHIRGAAFFDAGGAWDKEYRYTLGSIGTGVRINILNAVVLRYDIGKKIERDFTKLQPGLFYQFFFGWDF